MKHNLILSLFVCLPFASIAQNKDSWTAFYAADSIHIGYKDQAGVVKIEPKFMGVTMAAKFDDIIAVSEETDKGWKSYYLTKGGKEVGLGQLHIYDNGPDCESEGFIRFRERETGNVGLFDRNGEIVIPAEYNELTRVENGLLVGLKGAKKEYWSPHTHSGCNHYSWIGGEEVLLDTLNRVLVENFTYYDTPLNFYSLEKSKTPSVDPTRKNFPSTDGFYYSFVEYKTEFKQWLFHDLLVDFTADKLIQASYNTLYWNGETGRVNSTSSSYIEANFDLVQNSLMTILDPDADYFITMDELNPFMYVGEEFELYYNNCGDSKMRQYPTMSIIVNTGKDGTISQNNFEFLRTDNGYKLIAVRIRNGKVNGNF